MLGQSASLSVSRNSNLKLNIERLTDAFKFKLPCHHGMTVGVSGARSESACDRGHFKLKFNIPGDTVTSGPALLPIRHQPPPEAPGDRDSRSP